MRLNVQDDNNVSRVFLVESEMKVHDLQYLVTLSVSVPRDLSSTSVVEGSHI